MGSRINVRLVFGTTETWLYGHWFGYEAPGLLATAIRAAMAESDASGHYSPGRMAASIKHVLGAPRGQGDTAPLFSRERGPISPNFPTLTVAIASRRVTASCDPDDYLDIAPVTADWTFAEFCELVARAPDASDPWDTLRPADQDQPVVRTRRAG